MAQSDNKLTFFVGEIRKTPSAMTKNYTAFKC